MLWLNTEEEGQGKDVKAWPSIAKEISFPGVTSSLSYKSE